MKRSILWLLLLFCVIAIGRYSWLQTSRRPVEGDTLGKQQAEAKEQPTPEARVQTPPASPGTGPIGGQLTATGFIEPKVYCQGDAACLWDPTTAHSEADYRWLRQHGYPTREESQRLAALSETALQDEVRKGSLTAMTELGSRMTSRGDWNGLGLFLDAANRGSIYAYYAKSKAMQIRNAPMAGIVESGAYLRVAYMLGDYRAARVLQYDVIEKYNAVSPNESAMIDERAASLYRTYAKSRRPSPRPME